MSPEKQRLQVRYSELFDFRNLTKESLDIFVRWFLNEPLAEPSSSCLPGMSVSEQQPEISDDADEPVVDTASKSDTSPSDGRQSSEQGDVSQKPLAEPSPPSSPEMNASHEQLQCPDEADKSLNQERSEQAGPPQNPTVKPMWSHGCYAEGESLHQTLVMRPLC